ncbi:MAG: hypothetical protein RIS75_557 [Actinomycetota bacterium]
MGIYAAYAANLDPAHMFERAPHSPLIGPGWLNGWRLTFGGEDRSWQGALPTIVEDPTSQVFVMLYALTDADENGLDSAEGFDLGMYRKIKVRVSTLERDVTAWIYVVEGYEDGLPRDTTLMTIVAAATVAGAPTDYIADLAKRPTA